MTRIKEFDISTTLRLLEEVTPSDLEGLTPDDLEWTLADFVLSWGQRLSLDPARCLPLSERAHCRRFGQRYLPFSTSPDFPSVTAGQIRTLALAVTSHALFILVLDEIIDAHDTAPAAAKLVLQHLLCHSQRWYRALFPADSPFWVEAEQRAMTTTEAMWEEYDQHSDTISPFSLKKFQRIAIDKVAIAQINPIGLALLNNSPELVPRLSRCWDAIGLAATVLDDLRDWRQDYEARNFTYVLSQILLAPPFLDDVLSDHLPTVVEVGAVLFCSNHVEGLFDLAAKELDVAARSARAIRCNALADLIEQTLVDVRSDHLHLMQRKCMALLAAGKRDTPNDL